MECLQGFDSVHDHMRSGVIQSSRQKRKLGAFIDAKRRVMEICHEAASLPPMGKLENTHDLQQSRDDPEYVKLLDPHQIKESFTALTRQVKRFENKMAKTGGVMRMMKLPFDSRHRDVLDRAKEH